MYCIIIQYFEQHYKTSINPINDKLNTKYNHCYDNILSPFIYYTNISDNFLEEINYKNLIEYTDIDNMNIVISINDKTTHKPIISCLLTLKYNNLNVENIAKITINNITDSNNCAEISNFLYFKDDKSKLEHDINMLFDKIYFNCNLFEITELICCTSKSSNIFKKTKFEKYNFMIVNNGNTYEVNKILLNRKRNILNYNIVV